jgi:hypothetical protein
MEHELGDMGCEGRSSMQRRVMDALGCGRKKIEGMIMIRYDCRSV